MSTIILKLAEDAYAEDSGNAYEMAEQEAERTGEYPVKYPEPYSTIGCGFGPLSTYVQKECDIVAAELNLDLEFCDQAELMVILYGGSKADHDQFAGTLGERLQAVKGWIANFSELWPDSEANDKPESPSGLRM